MVSNQLRHSDEKQTVLESATALHKVIYGEAGMRLRWFQVTMQIGKEGQEKMGVGTKSKAILQHLL